ncbi:NAD(P)/FAD-dependent oxidoreductase [Kribbella sp. NPDC004536]|uniref:NAD(P)/FAD-dependent oxidoreductase n=1 Tax=Kribbella sp. NPDC004536 TaxID=3364106 RepID=UPI0036A1BF13
MAELKQLTCDVVVVGGRCAGAALAMLLAGRGYDVVVVDKSHLPTETLSTHGLARGGVVQLSRWNLLDAIIASGAPAVHYATLGSGGELTRRRIKDRAGVDLLVAPRRPVLDGILVDAATTAGASFQLGTTVDGLVRADDGRVQGIVARAADGSRLEIGARWVVGADGMRSRVADWVDADLVESFRSTCSVFYTYVADMDATDYEFHIAPGAYAGVFPTNDDEGCVWIIKPSATVEGLRSAGAGRPAKFVDELTTMAPTLGSRVRQGRIQEPVRGAADLPNFVRRPYGRGWALVGDAGYHRDPITGHGITDAFRDAELLGTALDRSLCDATSEREAMAAYQEVRDAQLRPTLDLTRSLTEFPAPERFVELQIELAAALDAEAEFLASLSAGEAPLVGRR